MSRKRKPSRGPKLVSFVDVLKEHFPDRAVRVSPEDIARAWDNLRKLHDFLSTPPPKPTEGT